MRTGFISTLSLVSSSRNSTLRMQTQLSKLNTEVTTSRLADAGLSLGSTAGRSMRLHLDSSAIDVQITSNGSATARLKQTSSALDTVRGSADNLMQQLITSANSPNLAATLKAQGTSALDELVSTLNSSGGDGYLFGGINTDTAPLNNYEGAPKSALQAAFFAKFGVTPDDPAAASIAPADMSDFLDNEFAAEFDQPAWGTNWSNASDQVITSRISQSQTVNSSVSANEPALRKLAMAYSMISGLGLDNLSAQTQETVVNKAIGVLGEATSSLDITQMNLGTAENRITDANDRMNVQKNLLSEHIDSLEGVDPAEAKVKIDTLTTQIEMSYSLTSKLLGLSILNYQ